MSCNEWIGLPTIEDVARAKVEWWEIEMRHSAREWEPWHRASWQVDIAYRGRPAQPKTETIHMRTALLRSASGSYYERTNNVDMEKWNNFVRWVGDPYKIEVPE